MKRRILILPKIKILEKIGFQPKQDEDQAISEIVLLNLFVSLLACLAGYSLGGTSEASTGWEVLISLVLVIIGFDLVKEFVGSTVKTVSSKMVEKEKLEGLKDLSRKEKEVRSCYEKELENIKQNTNEVIQAQRHRHYLSRIVSGQKPFSIGDLRLDTLNSSLGEEIDRVGANSFQMKLEKEFEEVKERRTARCLIQGLSDEGFLQPLALVAVMNALNKNNEEMNQYPEYIFFRDIYAYLKGWLICSIDNDNGVLMPISLIGLNYPDPKKPDRSLYEAAIICIKDDLLEQSESKRLLTESARNLMKLYLGQLLKLIKIHPECC